MNEKEYLELVKNLNYYSKEYYNNSNSVITDHEFDMLKKKLEEFENNNPDMISKDSISNNVGFKASTFNKVEHPNRMYSLKDVFSIEELIQELEKIEYSSLILEPKYDGLSLNLIYENNRLIKAVTRGDGFIGDDVTNNAVMINNINKDKVINLPNKTGGLVEIRGEVVMLKSTLRDINKKRLENNEKELANCRNAASGSLRQKDPRITKERNLLFLPFDITNTNREKISDTFFTLDTLYSIEHLEITRAIVNNNDISKVIEYIEKYKEIIKDTDIPLDGLVIKVNDINEQEKIGHTIKHPKWAFAFKFDAEEKPTFIRDVVLQIGRTGIFTPVAVVDEVTLSETKVNRVTLNNFDYIKSKNIKIGSKINLIKSGEIIPKITKVYDNNKNCEEIEIPITCPYCKSIIVKDMFGYYCKNQECKGRLAKALEYAVSRKNLNIDNLGESTIKQLVDLDLVKDIRDIYHLDKDKLFKLNNFKEDKINNVLRAIKASKGLEVHKVISSIGISDLGSTMSKKLISEYGLKILDMTYEDFINIKGIGESMAKSYSEGLSLNKKLILDIIELSNAKLNSKSKFKAVVTGVIHDDEGKKYTRIEIENMINKIGGELQNRVTVDTDYLFSEKESGKKFERAKELGIKILFNQEVINFLKDK